MSREGKLYGFRRLVFHYRPLATVAVSSPYSVLNQRSSASLNLVSLMTITDCMTSLTDEEVDPEAARPSYKIQIDTIEKGKTRSSEKRKFL